MVTKHYQDSGARWAITVPLTWVRLADDGDESGDVVFVIGAVGSALRSVLSKLTDDAVDPDIDMLLIMVMDGATLEQAAELWAARAAPGVGVVSTQQPGVLAGRPAQQTLLDVTVDGVTHRSRYVCVATATAVYTVAHIARLERYPAQEPQVSAALASFELLPAADQPPIHPAPDAEAQEAYQYSADARRLLRIDAHGSPAVNRAEGDPRDRKRIAALRALLADGSPAEQFYACVLLVSWADPAGYQKLLAWAQAPDRVPWIDDRAAPVADTRPWWKVMLELAASARDPGREVPDRPDPLGFDRLAGAVADSAGPGRRARTDLRLQAQRALLALVGDRAVASRLHLDYDRNLAALRPEITAAVQRCLSLIQTDAVRAFDLRCELPDLIGPLARLDDDAAAAAARRLVAMCPQDRHPVTLMVIGLTYAHSGPQIRAVLAELANDPDPGVAKYALAALAYVGADVAAAGPRADAAVRPRWVAGCLLGLVALSLLAFALIREARDTGQFSRGGRPGILAGGCRTDVTQRYYFAIFDTRCDGPVYDPTGRKYLGEASFHSFVRVGRHDVVRVRVIDAHDRSNLVVRPDTAIDTLGYVILVSTCAAVALGAAIGLGLEIRRSAKRYRVARILFRVAAGGLAASLVVSHTFHLPTAAASLAPVADPVVGSDGSVNADARVFASAQAAHYYRVIGHLPDTAQACGQVSGCAHGIAFTMIDSAGDLIAAGWRLRLTERGTIDQANRAVRDGRHPALSSVTAAAIHSYPVPPNRSADVVGLPGAREGGPGGSSHAPFQAGSDSYWSAQALGISGQGDEIIVVALTRTDGGRLTYGPREAAVLRDLRIILRGG